MEGFYKPCGTNLGIDEEYETHRSTVTYARPHK